MPLTGMGGFGASLAGSGGTAAGANASPALFGDGYASPPRSDPFLRGITGFADYAGGSYADPGERFEGAVGQAGNAFLAILKGASPTAPHDRALRQSAREAAKAKAEIGATQALFDAYMPAPRHDARAAAARLAAELGVPLGAAGPASTGSGYPPWRFGMAENPYLTARLSAGSDSGRYETPDPRSGYAAPMVPPHMVRDGFNSASRAAAARLAAHLGVVPPRSGGVMKVGTESPWIGVPPSLAASGYGPYAGLFNYPNRWLDLPRSKLLNSTLPESGADFRAMIAMLEWPGLEQIHELHTKYDYDPEEHGGEGQPGLYQLTQGHKHEMGATDAQGNWNPDYYPGITTRKEFLNDPIAQQRIFHDAMRHYDNQLKSKGAYQHLGQSIEGLIGERITITPSGLLAAAHRQGAEKVRQYLQHQRESGWNTRKWMDQLEWTNPEQATKLKSVEYRLRRLQDVRYN